MQFKRQNNDMLVPFMKQVMEFYHCAWAISTAAFNFGPITAAGTHNV
jgi:hypothetical protein